MTGWVWGGEDMDSDGVAESGIGWVSLHCSTDTTGCAGIAGNWGILIDDLGNMSGYAWSDNLGWISANSADLSGCPLAPCTARMSGSSLRGWMKALSANGNGWDGWISLSGASPAYGPTLSGTTFSGYAWGSDVVGWLSFAQARTAWVPCVAHNYCVGNSSMHVDNLCNVTTNQSPCSPGYTCSVDNGLCTPPPTPTGSISVTPKLIVSGDTTTVAWSSQDATSCTVAGTNGDGTGSNGTGVWSALSGSRTSSSIVRAVTYTLTCTNPIGVVTAVGSVTVSVVPRWREL